MEPVESRPVWVFFPFHIDGEYRGYIVRVGRSVILYRVYLVANITVVLFDWYSMLASLFSDVASDVIKSCKMRLNILCALKKLPVRSTVFWSIYLSGVMVLKVSVKISIIFPYVLQAKVSNTLLLTLLVCLLNVRI